MYVSKQVVDTREMRPIKTEHSLVAIVYFAHTTPKSMSVCVLGGSQTLLLQCVCLKKC